MSLREELLTPTITWGVKLHTKFPREGGRRGVCQGNPGMLNITTPLGDGFDWHLAANTEWVHGDKLGYGQEHIAWLSLWRCGEWVENVQLRTPMTWFGTNTFTLTSLDIRIVFGGRS